MRGLGIVNVLFLTVTQSSIRFFVCPANKKPLRAAYTTTEKSGSFTAFCVSLVSFLTCITIIVRAKSMSSIFCLNNLTNMRTKVIVDAENAESDTRSEKE